MKTIGLLGGMTCASTVLYYSVINKKINEMLGREHSAKLILYSVDFEDMAELMNAERWDEAGRKLGGLASRLEAAGADFLVICSNTMHKVAPIIEPFVRIPILHIVDVSARAIAERGFVKVGLLGTCFTMEHEFYRGRLERTHGIEVVVPPECDRAIIHRVIEEELGFGITRESSRGDYLRVIEGLAKQGAEGVILGCTEIPLLIGDKDGCVPLFNTTALHAEAAARFALDAW